jgi:protein-disulfide isomerase
MAIVAGFAMIALAIYITGTGRSTATPQSPTESESETRTSSIPAVTRADYIRGNPNAPILIVEYSDYDCPFCKVFHETMKQIIDTYGPRGDVAWVYRQLPISELHPNAPKLSEAALCVGELGGNNAFWTFSDLMFSERSLEERTPMSRLPEFANRAGVSEAMFTECLNSGRMQSRVEESVASAATLGIEGTPQSYVIVGDQQVSLEGAQTYLGLQTLIENILAQLSGTTPPVEAAEATTP